MLRRLNRVVNLILRMCLCFNGHLGLLFVSIIGLSLSPAASVFPLGPSAGLTLVQQLAADLWQQWSLLQLSHQLPALPRCRPTAVCDESTLVQYRVFVHSATATKVEPCKHSARYCWAWCYHWALVRSCVTSPNRPIEYWRNPLHTLIKWAVDTDKQWWLPLY